MSTITKQWLQQKIAEMEAARDEIPFGLGEDDSSTLAALRIALASLEAEVVAYTDAEELRFPHATSDMWPVPLGHGMDLALYTAAPAPVSLPDESAVELLATDLMKRIDKITGERHSVATLSSLRVSIVESCRAAMLQGAEPVTTANKLSFEQWLSQQTGTIDVECGCVMTEVFFHWLRVAYEAGNSPVIQDGWVACSDQMPKLNNGQIWIYSPTRGLNFMFALSPSGAFYDTCDSEEDVTDATHWMPIKEPSPPLQEFRRELFVSSEGNNCSKHPDTQLINHPHLQTASIPPHPVKYCPKCEPGVSQINAFRIPDEWHCNVNTKYFIYSPSVKSDKKITFVNSSFANCSEPEGDIQFINCTLPAEWEGKVNAIDCVFKAAPQKGDRDDASDKEIRDNLSKR